MNTRKRRKEREWGKDFGIPEGSWDKCGLQSSVGLIEVGTFEKRCEAGEGVAMQVSGEECPNVKALNWGRVWHVRETARKPTWLKQSEHGQE